MKKILIAILLLVPLIILFTLNTSASIVSAQIEIGVERMVLTHQGEEVDYVIIHLEDYIETNKKYTLFVNFTPTYVSNKDVEWHSSDTKVAKVKKQGSGAAVTFVKGSYGSVEIIATAVSNTSISASCTFFVTGNQLGRIDLYDYDTKNDISHTDLSVGENKQIGAKILPADSLGSNVIEWKSSNENIVKVDNNGVLKGVSKGVAFVSATVKKDNITISASVDVTVNEDAPASTDAIYVTEGSVDIERFLSSGAVIESVEGGKKTNDSVILDRDECWITVRKGTRKDKVYVKRVPEKALVLENYAAYKKGMWQRENYVAVGSANVWLSVVSSINEEVNAVWSSSNAKVAKVVNGRVIGGEHGKAVLTAKADGYAALELNVTVVEKLGDVNLELSELNDVAGLAEERVFGVYTCGSDLIIRNKLQMRIATTYPTSLQTYDDFYDYLIFESDNPEYATVDENGFVTFNRAAIGNNVKITVKGVFSDVEAQDSYTFKVVEGINIGYGVSNYYDKTSSTQLPDFDPFYEYRYLMEEYVGDYTENRILGAIVFQSNVYLPPVSICDFADVHLNRAIQGNGFVIDGQLHAFEFDSHIFASFIEADKIRAMCGDDYDIVVNNLYIQSYAPVSDDSAEAFEDLKERGGVAFRYDTPNETLADLVITFSYCFFRYAYMHVNPTSGKMVFDGCIFSNSAGPAIAQHGGRNDTNEVVIRNCIFSNTISPVYVGTRGNIEFGATDNSIWRYPALRLEGINYIYNWKVTNEVEMNIFPVSDNEELNSVLATLNVKISEYVYEMLNDVSNKKFVYKHPKGDYFNFGFFILGIWANHNMKINPTDTTDLGYKYSAVFFDESKYMCDELNFAVLEDIMLHREGGLTATLYKYARRQMGIDVIQNKSYLIIPQTPSGEYYTQPNETYQIDKKTKNRLHGINDTK